MTFDFLPVRRGQSSKTLAPAPSATSTSKARYDIRLFSSSFPSGLQPSSCPLPFNLDLRYPVRCCNPAARFQPCMRSFHLSHGSSRSCVLVSSSNYSRFSLPDFSFNDYFVPCVEIWQALLWTACALRLERFKMGIYGLVLQLCHDPHSPPAWVEASCWDREVFDQDASYSAAKRQRYSRGRLSYNFQKLTSSRWDLEVMCLLRERV